MLESLNCKRKMPKRPTTLPGSWPQRRRPSCGTPIGGSSWPDEPSSWNPHKECSGTRSAWHTYRAGDWKAASAALKKSDDLLKGNELSFNAFFLALAHWHLGNKAEARKWYDQAVEWMAKNKPQDEESLRFRAEAEFLKIR
jgi:hypothetical protein